VPASAPQNCSERCLHFPLNEFPPVTDRMPSERTRWRTPSRTDAPRWTADPDAAAATNPSSPRESLDGSARNAVAGPRGANRGRALLAWVCWIALIWLTLVAAAWLHTGQRLAVDQALTSLAMPMGLLWSSLLGLSILRLKSGRWRAALPPLLVAIALNVVGSWQLSSWAVKQLEARAEALTRPMPESLDAVVLLGGGTYVNERGGPQLSSAGDRLFEALQQYTSGRAKRLIVTGEPAIADPRGPLAAPNRSARELLISVGVPAEKITILGGPTTSGEMAELKRFFSQVPAQWNWTSDPQVGVVTSALHMPRVIRLAKAQGLKFIPIPCDYQGGPWRWNVSVLIPNARAAAQLHAALHEWLASFVGR